jgi:hypothetical protein
VREVRIQFDEIPPNLNDTIDMCKRHWSIYSKEKARWKELVRLSTLRVAKFTRPVEVSMTLTFPTNRRRDRDNFHGCYKYIWDGLSCLMDDNEDFIERDTLEKFRYEKGVTKTEVIIREI